jgi:outer membrane lipoprotein-sorting protein
MRTAIALILLGCAAIVAVEAQSLTTLSAEFVRTTRAGSTTETVKGTLFYQPPARVILRVYEPVSQWVVFETGSMLIWYPDAAKAFRFSEKLPSIYGFASTFVGVPRADFGLANAGFTLVGSESRDGTLLTRWKPPASLARSIGTATVGSRDRSPCMLEVTDAGGKFLARVSYTSYVSYGSLSIPSRIELAQMERGALVSEDVVYSGHEFNVELPVDVVGFRLPAGITVEETEW